jgi:hypothetical protein
MSSRPYLAPALLLVLPHPLILWNRSRFLAAREVLPRLSTLLWPSGLPSFPAQRMVVQPSRIPDMLPVDSPCRLEYIHI